MSLTSTKGPFLSERDIVSKSKPAERDRKKVTEMGQSVKFAAFLNAYKKAEEGGNQSRKWARDKNNKEKEEANKPKSPETPYTLLKLFKRGCEAIR